MKIMPGISAVAHYVPKKIKTSLEIEDSINLNLENKIIPGSLERLTGICQRHTSNSKEYNSTLAIEACKSLFKKESIEPSSIDLLIFASTGRDMLEPATAHIVQAEIGTSCPVIDVSNACNSFLNALEIAFSFVKLGKYKSVLIATGEVPSKAANFSIKKRELLQEYIPGYTFGDAGTAVLVDDKSKIANIIDLYFFAESKNWHVAMFPGGGSRFLNKKSAYFFKGDASALMEPFFIYTKKLLKEFLRKNNISIEDVQNVFVHQVAEFFLEKLSNELEIPMSKIQITIKNYGNVAAASLPLAFDLRLKQKPPLPNSLGLFIGLAGGMSISFSLIRFK